MVPVYTIIYQLVSSDGRKNVDFTKPPYSSDLLRAESLVNRWLDNKLYSCGLKVLLTSQDVNYVYGPLRNYVNNYPGGPWQLPGLNNFPVSTSNLLSVVVLYDEQATFNLVEVDTALKRFGQETAAKKSFQPYKVKNRLFESNAVYTHVNAVHFAKLTPL